MQMAMPNATKAQIKRQKASQNYNTKKYSL